MEDTDSRVKRSCKTRQHITWNSRKPGASVPTTGISGWVIRKCSSGSGCPQSTSQTGQWIRHAAARFPFISPRKGFTQVCCFCHPNNILPKLGLFWILPWPSSRKRAIAVLLDCVGSNTFQHPLDYFSLCERLSKKARGGQELFSEV